MLRIFVALTDNEPGVLDRIASAFRRRGFDLRSLTISPTLSPNQGRVTLLVDLDDRDARSAKACLERLLVVQAVQELTHQGTLVLEAALLRVVVAPGQREPLYRIAGLFNAEVLGVGPEDLIISCSGTPERLNALVEVLRPHGLLELSRSGVIAMGPCEQPGSGLPGLGRG